MRRIGLGRSSVLLLASTWTQTALGLLASILIGRTLGPPALGLLAANLGLAGLLMAALVPGFNRAHLKRLAEGQDPGRCLGTMLTIQLALLAALGAALAVAWGAGVRPGSDADDLSVFALMLGAQVAGKLADVFLQVFLARESVVPNAALQLGGRAVRLAATVAILAWAPSIVAIAGTFVIESGLVLAGAVLVLGRAGIRVRPPTRESVTGYWTYARPFLVTMPIALVQDSVDRWLVARWAGLNAAGHYHVARGLWDLLSGLVAPPGLMLFTRLSSLYAARSPERDREARKLFFRGLDKLVFVSTAVGFVLWALAALILDVLYGPAFVEAAGTLRVLILAALVGAVVNPYTFVLQAQDETGRFVPVSLLRLVVYLAALAVLVPGLAASALGGWLPAGATGAALARLLLILFPAWVYVRWTRELAGIPMYRGAWVYFAAFGTGVVAFELTRVSLARVVAAGHAADVAAAVLGAAVYAVVLWKTHPDVTEHVRYFRALVRAPLGPPADDAR
jgi:O-antigen/teichoic acid export membrane protein